MVHLKLKCFKQKNMYKNIYHINVSEHRWLCWSDVAVIRVSKLELAEPLSHLHMVLLEIEAQHHGHK